MTETRKPKTKWRWLKRGLFALVVLITLLAVVVVFENWRGRRAWANYRAELEAEGEVLDWRKLVPQDIPDDQNFAKTPLLAPLTEVRIAASGHAEFVDPQAKASFESMFDWMSELRGLGYWRKVETDDWVARRDELRSLTNSELPEIQALLSREPSSVSEDLLFLFSFSKNATDEITAAAKRPYSKFGSRADEDASALLSQLAVVKRLVHTFSVKGRVELLAGNTDAALSDWRTATSLSKFLDGDPLLISLLVSIAATENPLQIVWEGLSHRQWSEEQLIKIQSTLENRNLVEDAARALRGERNFSIRMMDQYLVPGGLPSVGLPGWFQRFFLSGIVSQNKISACRIYDAHALPLLDVAGRRVGVSDFDSSEQELLAAMDGFAPYHLLASPVVPAVTKALGKVANVQTAINLAMVACAIERYRLAEGENPGTLTELMPRFLVSVPLDFDEQPLRYRLESDGSFVLYSIGIDLTDDNGRIGKEDGTFTTDEGDWVWKYPTAAAKQDQ